VFRIFVAHPKEAFLLPKAGKLHDFALPTTDRTETFCPQRVGLLRGFRFFSHGSPPKVKIVMLGLFFSERIYLG
jgi:hypothetical protein